MSFPKQEVARPMTCGGWTTAQAARVREAAPDVILVMPGSPGVNLTSGRNIISLSSYNKIENLIRSRL